MAFEQRESQGASSIRWYYARYPHLFIGAVCLDMDMKLRTGRHILSWPEVEGTLHNYDLSCFRDGRELVRYWDKLRHTNAMQYWPQAVEWSKDTTKNFWFEPAVGEEKKPEKKPESAIRKKKGVVPCPAQLTSII